MTHVFHRNPRLPLPNAVMTRQFLASCGLGLL